MKNCLCTTAPMAVKSPPLRVRFGQLSVAPQGTGWAACNGQRERKNYKNLTVRSKKILAQDSFSIFDLDSSQIAYVRFLAYHLPESQATTAAKAILGLLFGEDFEIVFPTEPTGKLAGGNQQPADEKFGIDPHPSTGSGAAYGLIVRHYPEPSGNSVYLECFVPSEVNGAILKIYSVTGEEQTTIKLNDGQQLLEINTFSWSSGMYFYSITAGNGDLIIGKMTKVAQD